MPADGQVCVKNPLKIANFTLKNYPYPTPPSTDMIQKWQAELREKASPEKIETLSRFFKTGPGQYGEGDIFIGLSVPANREISKKYFDADIQVIRVMIESAVHEFRLAALLALVERYRRTKDDPGRRCIAELYLDICHLANNWDLVDLSAPYIIGAELIAGRSAGDIITLSTSPLIWHRRIAVVSTLLPIRKGQLDTALDMCDRHIADSEQLMQKAVGWVLRECGKKDRLRLEQFINDHIAAISATTLSYATEKFSQEERAALRAKRNNSQNRLPRRQFCHAKKYL